MSVKVHCPKCKAEVSHLPAHDLCFMCLPTYIKPDPIKSAKLEAKAKILAVLQKELDDIQSGEKYKNYVAIINHQTYIDTQNVKYFMALINATEV